MKTVTVHHKDEDEDEVDGESVGPVFITIEHGEFKCGFASTARWFTTGEAQHIAEALGGTLELG